MGLKDRIENHWLPIMVGVAIAAGGITASVTGYFSSQAEASLKSEHKIELQKKQEELGKVQEQLQFAKLRIKGDTIELSSFVQQESEALKPPNSKEFDSGQFYAAEQIGQWKLSISNSIPVVKPFGSVIIRNVMAELESFPETSTYRWVGGDTVAVTGSKVLANLYPYIVVQRAATKAWHDGFVSFWQSGGNANMLALVLGVGANKITTSMKSLSDTDIGQMIFLFEFSKRQLAAIVDSSISFKTLVLQKQDDILYARFLTSYTKIILDGTPTERLYVREQLMVIPTRKNIFVISTFSPSAESLSEHDSDGTSDWFSQLVIIR